MSKVVVAETTEIGANEALVAGNLAERVLCGDRRAAARLITLIENRAVGIEREMRRLVTYTGRAHIVGVTGSPGSGKSTLVGQLAREFRSRGQTVGVIAVDPTSPFTGGAVLGDRIRMRDVISDRGVFIRSMASRGALGGLSSAAADAAKVLDAYGCRVILVETVGAGQDEVDIAKTAHTTVVVQVPGMGDEVQAIKAGILEIGDVFAVNKSDRARADVMVSELRMMLGMATRPATWSPPIVKTVATTSSGVTELADAIQSHLAYLHSSGEMAKRLEENARRELLDAARQQLLEELEVGAGRLAADALVLALVERRIDARTAARELMNEFRSRSSTAAQGSVSSPSSHSDGRLVGQSDLASTSGDERQSGGRAESGRPGDRK
jgi:LAO/AO transport system kinase